MKKKRKIKASGNRLMIFGSLSIFIISFFIYTLFSYIIQVKELNNEQLNLQNSLIVSKEEEINLKNEIVKLKDEDYLARFARENYMYSKDGEYIIKVSDKEKVTEEVVQENKKNYIGIVIIACILSFVVLFIKKVV